MTAAASIASMEPIAQEAVCEALGYDSITYFERVFHKYAEVSPSRYRKQYQDRPLSRPHCFCRPLISIP